ncbi:MAG TPA: proton-conducting transporter membrane subunit [Polyangiaceae bacterium]|nr:proton-conducting transporter membrane subunit [Polyangiaceae bacterium]
MNLLLASLVMLVGGGVAALALSSRPRAASWTGALSCIAAGAVGTVSTARALLGFSTGRVELGWNVPGGGIVLDVDPLSAFFLLPVFVLGAIVAFYGRTYLDAYRAEKALGVPWLAYNVLLASMVVVLTARHALLFLAAWEVMSLSSYVLFVFEHERAEVQRAGWVYLVAAHVGMAFLVTLFLVLESETGTLIFGSNPPSLARGPHALVLVLAFAGFGVKAGLLPLHVWLPGAHAAAPSHVSALMSGVVIKMGIYGLVRATLLTGPPPTWWGPFLLTLGLAGALYGICMAASQRDLKRVLAYSSVENIGLVAAGLGLCFWGVATRQPVLSALGLTGALFHIWNHSAMKGLLFLGAGAIVHATGTRDMERLGGLLRRLPTAGTLIIVGSLAIAGLPPLNGFVSEWLLYRSLLEGAARGTPGASVACMLALGALSAVGALAALCFLRVCSVVLLGEPRSPSAANAHDAGSAMSAAMVALAAGCLVFAFIPTELARVIRPVAAQISPDAASSTVIARALAPVGDAMRVIAGLLLLAAVLGLRPRSFLGKGTSSSTWGCGYAAPTARMQYTARSFGQLLVDVLPGSLRPKIELERPSGFFPVSSRFATRSEDPFIGSLYEPAIRRAGHRMARLRWFQQGALQMYVLYILVALALGLAWASFGDTVP